MMAEALRRAAGDSGATGDLLGAADAVRVVSTFSRRYRNAARLESGEDYAVGRRYPIEVAPQDRSPPSAGRGRDSRSDRSRQTLASDSAASTLVATPG